MNTSTSRLLELALKGLALEKERIEAEMASLQAQMKGAARATRAAAVKVKAAATKPAKKKIQLTPEESRRRSERMKAYWIEWRKKKAATSKPKAKAKKS